MNFLGKKPEKKTCGCGAPTPKGGDAKDRGGNVKILGGGCAKCGQLEKNTLQALADLGMDTAVDHVTDWAQIAAYGVMSTPALVVDGKVVAFGKVLKPQEVAVLLRKARP